jgi:transposase-like protein
VKLDVEARVREGVKAVLQEVLEEEMTHHLEAGYRELTPTRRGERNGHYLRNPLTSAGKIERLEVPREDREGEFVTELFERYKRMRPATWRRLPPRDVLFRDLGEEDRKRHGSLEQGKSG